MSNQQTQSEFPQKILRFLPLILLQVAYAVLAYHLFSLVDDYFLTGDWYDELLGTMLIGGSMICEIAFCLTIAGLVGRHWLIGFSIGSALLAVQGYLFIRGGQPDQLHDQSWGLCGIPAVFLLACIPLFLMRRIFGWRLMTATFATRPQSSIEGLFVTTLVVACCLVAFRMPYSAWRVDYAYIGMEGVTEPSHWLMGAGTSLFAGLILLLLVVPVLWIWFKGRSLVWKCIFQLMFFLLAGGFATGVVYLVQLTAIGRMARLDEAFYYGVAQLAGALPTYLVQIYTLRLAGLRFPKMQDRAEPEAATNATPETTLASSPFSEDISPKQKSILKVITVPRFIATAILLATIIGSGLLQIELQKAEQRFELTLELGEFVASNGGSLETYDGRGWSLALWQGATDEDLLRFKTIPVRSLGLADADVSAQAIAELERVEILESVELSSRTEIGAALRTLCVRSRILNTITVSDAELKLSDLQPIRYLRGEEIYLSLERCRFDPNSTAGFYGFPAGVLTIDAFDCKLTDKLIRNWFTENLYVVDLRQNAITGDIDFSPLQGDQQPYRHIDLSGNPLDDELLGKSVVGMKLHHLGLSETPLTDRFFDYLKRARSVRGLELNSDGFTEEALAAANPKGLQTLNLEAKQFTGHSFKDWHPKSLKTLSLAGSSADDETMKYLKSLPSLRRLKISNTKISAKAILESGLGAEVEISVNVNQYTAKDMQRLLNKFPGLQEY